MRRFILTVLAPVGDMVATACTLLMLNALAASIAYVYLLPGSLMMENLAFIYILMAMAAAIGLIVYAVILLGLALRYGVPLKPIFIDPDDRVNHLEEAEEEPLYEGYEEEDRIPDEDEEAEAR